MSKHYNKRKMEERRKALRHKQTQAEAKLWDLVRNRRCLNVKFRRQYSVDYYILDFYAPEIKLAIEVDGGVHNINDQQEYDRNREEYLESFGISIIRFTNEEILTKREDVIRQIKQKINKLREQRPHP